jgi:hypothetical protein
MSSYAISVFRTYLRAAQKFPDVNIREFLKRRAKEEFRKYAQETDQAAVNKALKHAKENIAMIERTSLVYGVYAPKHTSVLGK